MYHKERFILRESLKQGNNVKLFGPLYEELFEVVDDLHFRGMFLTELLAGYLSFVLVYHQ